MQDYMKTIVNGLMTYNKSQKADWNENDASAIGYIKNRTHWTGKEWGTIIEKQSDGTYQGCPLWHYREYYTDPDMRNKVIYPNETYKITFNGTVYYCTSWQKGMYANAIFLGNKYQLDNNEEETQEPFLIIYDMIDGSCSISFITPTAFQIKIEGYIEKIHKIDSKYLPLQNLVDGRAVFSVAQHSCSALSPNSHAEGEFTTTSAADAHAEGFRTEAAGAASHAEGQNTTASGNYGSHAEGYSTHATGESSHAEGDGATASGESSHAEGGGTIASGIYSHAEGVETEASGNYSHAEGAGTIASDDFSHAEGVETEASGEGSHAEGGGTIASGDYSHAEGGGTIASGDYSHVQGKYNIADTENKYAHIVGNGEYSYDSSLNSNAHTLDWEGNAWFAGNVYVGGTSQDNGEKLITESEISKPKPYFTLIDSVNGYNYIIEMRNGNLVSRCGVSSIEVTTMPDKIEYYAGEYFDPTGMVITATCEDGSVIEITNYTCSDNQFVIGANTIIISYIEAGNTYTTTITVNAIEFDAATVLVDFNYIDNGDGTYTITAWKGTKNGVASTEMIVPNSSNIIL